MIRGVNGISKDFDLLECWGLVLLVWVFWVFFPLLTAELVINTIIHCSKTNQLTLVWVFFGCWVFSPVLHTFAGIFLRKDLTFT